MIDSMIDKNDQSNNKKTMDFIAIYAIDFLLAGHDTTTILLNYTSYMLALNTDVQEKLQAEIDKYFEEDPVIVMLITARNTYKVNMAHMSFNPENLPHLVDVWAINTRGLLF